MTGRRESVQFTSRFVSTYSRLFEGLSPEQISHNQDESTFWSTLLELEVDRDFLSTKFAEMRKDDCLAQYKPVLNAVTSSCLHTLRAQDANERKKRHAAVTLTVLTRGLLSKNLTGWEVMEVFAGSVSDSDRVFQGLTDAINEILSDSSASVLLRHEILQLAVIFVCGISQLSPGAYFLRHDLFPCIVTTITSPDTEQFTFEAALLLALLANFHKSDAASLNPYLRRIQETKDVELMRNISWAANFASAAVVKAYQSIVDDSPPTLASSFGSFLSALRPDRALASKPVDPPRELFKNQPIEACVILLPVFEFLKGSATFRAEFIGSLDSTSDKKSATLLPLPLTLLSLSSYLLTHASSSSSPRATAYANLAMNILLVMIEHEEILSAFSKLPQVEMRLCRQRLPDLPLSASPNLPVCALLDCCVLWLRHNLHKKLEVYTYITCVRISYRVLWYLQKEQIRPVYHWQELWRALVLLLDFLASKLDSLITTGGVELLVQEVTILLFDLALCQSEHILPSAKAVHELVYEVVRSAEVFRKQQVLLEKLAGPQFATRRRVSGDGPKSCASESLKNILTLAEHYETKAQEAGIRSANQGLRVVAKEIDADGLSYEKVPFGLEEPPKHSEEVVGFIRFAYVDGMALMP